MLYIPFSGATSIGGPSTFLKNLQGFLTKKNYLTTETHASADSIFFPISFETKDLQSYKERGLPIIQRLDGICYPSKHGPSYLGINQPIKDVYQNFSTHIVFQSEYSRQQVEAMFGHHPRTQIILNGVHREIFYPAPAKRLSSPLLTFKFVTTGNFRNTDMLEPMIAAFDQLKSTVSFQLTIIGPIKEHLVHFLKRDYITYLGPLNLSEVAAQLRDHDAFVYSHLNPPCPNSVIEAISCALPVVGFASGAMTELLPFATDLLAPVSQEVFQVYEDFKSSLLAEKIVHLTLNYEKYYELAYANQGRFDFSNCGQAYLDLFESARQFKST